MTAERKSSPPRARDKGTSRTRAHKGSRRSAAELLRLGQYERLASLIRQETAASGFPRQAVDTELIDAAQWMCEACLEARNEAAWHRSTLTRLSRREQELSEKLGELLRLLEGGKLVSDERPASARPSEPTAHVETGDVSGSAAGSTPVLSVHCLGTFQVYLSDRLIEDWPNGKGKAIFKFLVARPDRTTGKEILMDHFWPDAQPDAARNNLNVAIYSIRRAFSRVEESLSVILFDNERYLINPDLSIWIDYEAFLAYLAQARAFERSGDMSAAINRYRCAEAVYRGEFLEEDRYEDWVEPLRASLRADYLAALARQAEYAFAEGDYGASVALCSRMLEVDPCYESSHRLLMRCWSRQGVPHLAIRQYDVCRESLERELHLQPGDETADLLGRIRQRKPV